MSGLRFWRGLGAASACALTLAACGGDDSGDPSFARQSIADQAKALGVNLVSSREIAEAGERSALGTLLRYWSHVQYGDYRRAATMMEPGLARLIGVRRLTAALRNASRFYRAAKPVLRGTIRGGDVTTVRYLAPTQAAEGKLAPLSASMRRTGPNGTWRLIYLSALDDELRIATQFEIQMAVDPGAQRPHPRAISAGVSAAALQGAYLARINRPPGATR